MSRESWIWGFHAIEGCLENYPELMLELYLEKNSEREFAKKLSALGGKPQIVERLPKAIIEKRTQGIGARIKYFPTILFNQFRDDLEGQLTDQTPRQWAILDRVEDPRNFGAILRSACGLGVTAVFVLDHHQAPMTGVVAQASAGTSFRIPVIVCSTWNPLFQLLEEHPVHKLGLDGDGRLIESVVQDAAKAKPAKIFWFVGSEGEGLRHGLKEKCETLVKIPMTEGVESLNVSVASSLAFYCSREAMNR